MTSTKFGLYSAIVVVAIEVIWLASFQIAFVVRATPSSIHKTLDWAMAHYKIISNLPFEHQYLYIHPDPDRTPDIFVEFCAIAIVGIIAFFLGMLLHSIVKKLIVIINRV